jgi:hypothetical protein
MATWEFLSKRRRMKLEDFVKGAKTLEEAKAVFERKKVDLPVDGSLEKLFAKPIPVKKAEKPKAEVTKPKAEGNVSYTGGMQVEVKEPVVVTKAAVVEEAKPTKKTTRKKKATKKKSTKASDEG